MLGAGSAGVPAGGGINSTALGGMGIGVGVAERRYR